MVFSIDSKLTDFSNTKLKSLLFSKNLEGSLYSILFLAGLISFFNGNSTAQTLPFTSAFLSHFEGTS